MPSYGSFTNPDGELELRRVPISYVAALPGAGDFPGHIFWLGVGSIGLYVWTGATFVGPLGTGGGGGGAPTTAQYLVAALDGVLSAERLVTDNVEMLWDLATAGQAKLTVGVIAQAKITNLVADLAARALATRLINTTAPLTGGGDLTADRTLAVSSATTAAVGVVELATDGEVAANVVVQGNDARLSNSRPPDGAAGGDLTGTYPSPDIAAGAVTNVELADMAAITVKGRAVGAGTGDPQDLTRAQLRTVIDASQVIGSEKIPIAETASGKLSMDWIKVGTPPAVFTTEISGAAPVWNTPAQFPSYACFRASGQNLVWPKLSDATTVVLPASPGTGQIYYHKDHKASYRFDSVAGGWLSTHIHELPFGHDVDLAATNYTRFNELNGFALFTDTRGHIINGLVKVVGLALVMDAVPPATTTIQVFDDGVAVTGATLTLTTAQTRNADETLMSANIAANSVIGVKVTAGTIQGPCRGTIRLRRFTV